MMAETLSGVLTSDAGGWAVWSAAERESFFHAIARHRRAAWRVTLASSVGNLVVALIVATLMAPLFYGAIALLLDVVNLIIPAPNLVPGIGHVLDKPFNAPRSVSVLGWIRLGAIAALPGLIWMAFVLGALRRVLRLCMTLDAGELQARAPDTTVLAEQRFANVVAEMAIAADVAAPRVLVAGSNVVDAVAFGVDAQHATIVISQGLLAQLDRAQMEGVAAHLIASVADGDMEIGVRAALSVSLFSLLARLGSLVVNQRNVRRDLGQILRVALLPTASSAQKFVVELASPFEDAPDDPPDPASAAGAAVSTTPPTTSSPASAAREPVRTALQQSIQRWDLHGRWEKIRALWWLPLAGPLVMTGFFGAIVNLFVLGPLVSLTWRQRKYMADATAVRLTRDPDTLAGALEKMAAGRGIPLAPWAAHMSVVSQNASQPGVFGSSAVPMFPSIDRRLRALGTMGAHLARAPRKLPLMALVIIVPLFAIVGGLVAIMLPLLIWLSMGLTMLFSGLPFAIVHLLLRWMGHA